MEARSKKRGRLTPPPRIWRVHFFLAVNLRSRAQRGIRTERDIKSKLLALSVYWVFTFIIRGTEKVINKTWLEGRSYSKRQDEALASTHSRPQSLRSCWPAVGIESSGSNFENRRGEGPGDEVAISGMRHRWRLRETGWAEFGYFLCYFKMVAPGVALRALDSCRRPEGS